MNTLSSTPASSLTGPEPRGRAVLSADELVTTTGISHVMLWRLVRLGLVEPVGPGGTEFPARCAPRLKRMLRLRVELGVNLPGASVIVDLLERLARLETELSHVRGGG
jgi:MerR family transcriptional regulator, heat shock protein HspR